MIHWCETHILHTHTHSPSPMVSHTSHIQTQQQSQWQVLDERVIDTRDLDTEYEVQYLPETRTMLPPPSVEYVKVCVFVCVCGYQIYAVCIAVCVAACVAACVAVSVAVSAAVSAAVSVAVSAYRACRDAACGCVGVCIFLYVCSCVFMFVLLTWHCSPSLFSHPSIECDKLGCVYVVVRVYPHVCVVVCVRVWHAAFTHDTLQLAGFACAYLFVSDVLHWPFKHVVAPKICFKGMCISTYIIRQ